MSLLEKLADLSLKNYQLLEQNVRIGKAARPRADQNVRKMLTPIDEELIREYNEQMNQPIEYTDPATGQVKYRKFRVPDVLPDLEEEPLIIPDAAIENEIQMLEEQRSDINQSITDIEADMKSVMEEKRQLIQMGNSKQISKKEYNKKIKLIHDNYDELLELKNELETKLHQTNNEIVEAPMKIREQNAKALLIKKSNLEKVNIYRDQLNLLNRGAFDTQKSEAETEAQYLERLKQNAEILVPEQELENAKLQVNKRFKEKMKELIRDYGKIESIGNMLDDFGEVENKAQILKTISSR